MPWFLLQHQIERHKALPQESARFVQNAMKAVLAALLALVATSTSAWRQHIYWNDRQWCEEVFEPSWPNAYQKESAQDVEFKGRSASDYQHLGHECTTEGARSKCHICENIQCGALHDATCAMQIQGISTDGLPQNIPTVHDTPFAVGGSVQHRHDFGNAERVCVVLSGGGCLTNQLVSYGSCRLRCWGHSHPAAAPFEHGWEFNRSTGNPQGRIETLAGSATSDASHADGTLQSARFSRPQGVFTHDSGDVFVADTENHCIRHINVHSNIVSTIAGVPRQAGFLDGLGFEALFSSPVGIVGWEVGGAIHLAVSDTFNHRVRELVQQSTGIWIVSTLAGGGTDQPTLLNARDLSPGGFADGVGGQARFDNPRGLAVSGSRLYVADTNNHLIRRVYTRDGPGFLKGETSTYVGQVADYPIDYVAGNPQALEAELPGCVPPCQEGKQGYRDATLRTSQLNYPYDVAIAEAGDNGVGDDNIVFVDGDRVRMAISSTSSPVSWLGVQSNDRVVTLAGSTDDGDSDGVGISARFDKPRGVAVDAEGRIYVADTQSCRLRRLSPARRVVKPLLCEQQLVDVLRPQGCDMYDQAVDNEDLLVSSSMGNVVYNNGHSVLNGRRVKKCVGSPPPHTTKHSNRQTLGPYNGTGSEQFTFVEDTAESTTYRLLCPTGCAASTATIQGDGTYSDTSAICVAAIHAGVLDSTSGGMITVRLQLGRGLQSQDSSPILGSTRHLITSANLVEAQRTFTVEPYSSHLIEVQTIAGSPNAPIENLCGYKDSQPAIGALFRFPAAVSLDRFSTLSQTSVLAVADADNNVIRLMTAVCSQPCENGGVCVGAEQCQCPVGWTGVDCARPVCSSPCGPRELCTGADQCSCIPGYSGSDCQTALCAQTCQNNGVCGAPDTCTCASGWFDANCTTPVCSQTCGNGGNCTAPNTCSCPEHWMGNDCRTPVCTQACQHGSCVAPDTCMCDAGWSGHDCSKPVCTQGFLVKDPNSYLADSADRPISWQLYSQCDFSQWCDETNEFDCQQADRRFVPGNFPSSRRITGRKFVPQSPCTTIEIAPDAVTSFRYRTEEQGLTEFWRFAPPRPYKWGPRPDANPWASPSFAYPDRQVAHVAFRRFDQGVYACANGGSCTAPDKCVCAAGWAGFDCRIPVCDIGYFNPLAPGLVTDPRYPRQGFYQFVSDRTVTVWESFASYNAKFPEYMHEHPNYFSRYNGPQLNGDNFPVVYQQRPSLPPGDNTYEGWRRTQWWERDRVARWSKGRAAYTVARYKRVCRDTPAKAVDLLTGQSAAWTLNTTAAYIPRVDYSDPKTITAEGRWFLAGGECVDTVERGCFNGGKCTAPNTCECPPGWEGHDCTLPVCENTIKSNLPIQGVPTTLLRSPGTPNLGLPAPQAPPPLQDDVLVSFRQCQNNGNCTHPNICTCEIGWSGPDCSVPLCSQECMNGGECIAPDVCECNQWESAFKDNRNQPYFKKPDGTAQMTGWTGFDCTVPICVQHLSFILNNVREPTQLAASVSDGSTFQAGCAEPSRFTPTNATRKSSKLCKQEQWYQGQYETSWSFKHPAPISWETHEAQSRVSPGRFVRVNHPNFIRVAPARWIEGPVIEGEGIYACYNSGSCVAPDSCECSQGWDGYDCNTPTCEPKCKQGGVCGDTNTCVCASWPSILHEVHEDVPKIDTGYNGTDCSMSVCAQGFYEANCTATERELAGITGGEPGCFKCANGGVCSAPDTCSCPPEWTGFDCKTPVCTIHADSELLLELNSVDPAVIAAFELDPCMSGKLELFEEEDMLKGRGNCTAPNTCTCLCFNRAFYDEAGELSEEPWVDPLQRSLEPGQGYGSYTCLDGFEGRQSGNGVFASCHLSLKVPTFVERYTLLLLGLCIGIILFSLCIFVGVRYQLLVRAKAYRKKRRRRKEVDDDYVDLEKAAHKERRRKKGKKEKTSKGKRKGA